VRTVYWASPVSVLSRTPAVINKGFKASLGGRQFIEQAAHQCPAAVQSPLLAQATQPGQGGQPQVESPSCT